MRDTITAFVDRGRRGRGRNHVIHSHVTIALRVCAGPRELYKKSSYLSYGEFELLQKAIAAVMGPAPNSHLEKGCHASISSV